MSEEHGTAIELAGGQLLAARTPQDAIDHAVAIATPLAKVIEERQLFVEIRGKRGQVSRHVRVEGWLLLGNMLPTTIHPHTVWTRRMEEPFSGWEACVEARTIDGKVVSTAESSCARDERKWKDSDDYAIRSMAQTRATSKALGQALRFIMSLAGFDPTPAEEIDSVVRDGPEEAAPWQRAVLAQEGVTEGRMLAAARALAKEKGRDPRSLKSLADYANLKPATRVELCARLNLDPVILQGAEEVIEAEVVEDGEQTTGDTEAAEVVDTEAEREQRDKELAEMAAGLAEMSPEQAVEHIKAQWDVDREAWLRAERRGPNRPEVLEAFGETVEQPTLGGES